MLKKEYGKLSLAPDENYRMGGPGMVLSRATLFKLIEKSHCSKNEQSLQIIIATKFRCCCGKGRKLRLAGTKAHNFITFELAGGQLNNC